MNEETLFHEALAKPNAFERAAFLEEACAGRPELLAAVSGLLAAHEEAAEFLNSPPPDLGGIIGFDPALADTEATCPGSDVDPPQELQAKPISGETSPSVLDALGQVLGDVPRVLLRDEASGDDGPVALSQSGEMPPLERPSRYQLHGEIARGGMGAILKGRDIDLGRDLAIKVLLDSHKDKPEIVRRFIEEAQIGGQLQHPGIVPVYELGQFADHRPFFSMKLIKGQTLASLLTGRKHPAEDRTRFLGIFHQVCQTLAYAHSRGVIHRDLKPANIMVGTFGEVQVMDWGLAKVLAAGGLADEKKARQPTHSAGDDRIRRQDGGVGTLEFGSHTIAGSVMGTLAYMAPEQAMGEVDRLDERSDVFGLGAILCEILSGAPPYRTKDTTELLQSARRGELDDCYARLESCGAEHDLIDLAKECLAPAPEDRPKHAGALAERVSAYLASVDARLRKAEIERAAESARAQEALRTAAEAQAKTRAERRARRLQVGMAVVVVSLTTAAGLAAGWTAVYQSRLKQDALDAEQTAIAAQHAEAKQRQRAEAEKRRADITLADTETARGLRAGDRHAPGDAILWFAAAAAQAETADDHDRAERNRLRARNYTRQAILPVAALSLSSYPTQVEFQPGGGLLLVHTYENRVVLWSWLDDALLPWAEDLAQVSAACFSPDGASVALGFLWGELQIRSVPDGRVAKTARQSEPITVLAFSSDGKLIAVGGTSARLWDTTQQAFLPPVYRHPRPINALLFDRQATRLITGCGDNQARVFAVGSEAGSAEPLFAPLLHAPKLPSPPALIDGDHTLVTVAGDSELACWNMATGKPASSPIRTRAAGLQKVAASTDGNWFVTGGYYGPEVHSAGPDHRVLYLGHTNLVRNFVFSRDSSILLSVGLDSTARLWSLLDGEPLGRPLVHMGNVDQCAISDDGDFVATAQANGLVRVWRRPTDDLIVGRAVNWGQRPRLSSDGALVAPGLWHEAPMAYDHQGTSRLRVIAAASGKPPGPDIPLPGYLVDSCICSGNRSIAAVTARVNAGNLGVWELATARPVFEPIALAGLPSAVAARPASTQLAALCSTGLLLVIDARTGKTLLSLHHEGWAADNPRRAQIQYSPDGATLVSLGDGAQSTVNVRDADSGRLRFAPLRPVLEGGAVCRSFAISADSRLLATIVNGKNAAQVWDLHTGQSLSRPLPHPGDYYGLYSVAFSPDGQRLLTGSKDGQVRYWDWRAAKLACPPMVHEDEAFDTVITPDGRFALTTCRNQSRLRVWELSTGRPIAPPVQLSLSEEASSHTLAVTPDGRRAVVVFKPADLAIVDLEALVSPVLTPTADLRLMAELATAQQIELGDLSGLTQQQWEQRFSLLRQRNSQLARYCAAEMKSEAAVQTRIARAADRGNEFARRGQWAQASREALTEIGVNPHDRQLWSKAAPRLILAGDVGGYRLLCRRMVETFGRTSDPEEAESLCTVCSLLPDAMDRSHLPVQLLSDSLAQGRGPDGFAGSASACLALVAYRGGDFAEAARFSEMALSSSRRTGPAATLALSTLAMAQHQLQQRDQARRSLAECRSLVPGDLRTLGSPEFREFRTVSAESVGPEWLAAGILRREAERLIQSGARRPVDAAARAGPAQAAR